MRHFITGIQVIKLGNLENMEIVLNKKERQHLILTGRNGSGKSLLLSGIRNYLASAGEGEFSGTNELYMNLLKDSSRKISQALTPAEKTEALNNYKRNLEYVQKFSDGVELIFNSAEDISAHCREGKFVTAYFPAGRRLRAVRAKGVEDICPDRVYGIGDEPAALFVKYMIHLKTQQAYARNEGDFGYADLIQRWFVRLDEALRALSGDRSMHAEYSYREYDFLAVSNGRQPVPFDRLSDGMSAALAIVADLMLRMDYNWLEEGSLRRYDREGIVLIDEPEAHLHVSLQKTILPFLIRFFPGLQFIVATHSPYVRDSISNVMVYDLEEDFQNP